MTPETFLVGGGTGGFVIAIAYVVKQILDAWNEHRRGEVEEKSASVVDAETANAIALKTLDALNSENKRLHVENTRLKDELAAKDAKIIELTAALADAQRKMQYVADELAKLKSAPA